MIIILPPSKKIIMHTINDLVVAIARGHLHAAAIFARTASRLGEGKRSIMGSPPRDESRTIKSPLSGKRLQQANNIPPERDAGGTECRHAAAMHLHRRIVIDAIGNCVVAASAGDAGARRATSSVRPPRQRDR